MRRRHSVTSISPDPSPTSQPPPLKKVARQNINDSLQSNRLLRKLSNIDKPTFLIEPDNFFWQGELWDELFDAIMRKWRSSQEETMNNAFSLENWTDDLISLGFGSEILEGVAKVFKYSEERFGKDIVEMILSYESVGEIAELVLWGEVNYFSNEVTRTRTTTTTNDNSEDTSQSSEAPTSISNSPDSLSLGHSHTSSMLSKNSQTPPDDDDDDDDPTKHPKSAQQQPTPSASTLYPQWLHDLHNLAAEKGIEIVFSNTDITDSATILPPCVLWDENITGTTASVYHGTEIINDALEEILSSFLNYGVETTRVTQRGYYCVTAATYFTNCPAYCRVWPVMKSHLHDWRSLSHLPVPNVLIIVSEPTLADVLGTSGRFSTAIIPQNDTELARHVPPSSSSSLTCKQYVNATRDIKNKSRIAHRRIPSIETSDFIVAPLPTHTIDSMQRAPVGQTLHSITPIQSLSILTCATNPAVDYMNEKITKIIVLGWGNGNLGATDQVEFGTAGIKIGNSEYDNRRVTLD